MSLPLGFLCIRTERVFLYAGRVPETMEIIAASTVTPIGVRHIVITTVVITIFIPDPCKHERRRVLQ